MLYEILGGKETIWGQELGTETDQYPLREAGMRKEDQMGDSFSFQEDPEK